VSCCIFWGRIISLWVACDSSVILSTDIAFERKRENHIVSHRCTVCMAYLRFIVLWVLPHFLWKGIKWKVIYRLLSGHFLEGRLFFLCVRLVCTRCVQLCIWCSFGSLDCMLAALNAKPIQRKTIEYVYM